MVRAVLGFVAAALLWTVAFLAVVALAAPAVLLGDKMAAGFLRRATPAVAA
jgi:hypothetical protein